MIISGRIKSEIVAAVSRKFRCFGKGTGADSGNPIAAATEDMPAHFALGVDVEQVVAFVISEYISRAGS